MTTMTEDTVFTAGRRSGKSTLSLTHVVRYWADELDRDGHHEEADRLRAGFLLAMDGLGLSDEEDQP